MGEQTQTKEQQGLDMASTFDAEALAASILDVANHVESQRKKKNKAWSMTLAKQVIVKRNLEGMEWHKAVQNAGGNAKIAGENAPDSISVKSVMVNDNKELTFKYLTDTKVKTNHLAAPYWQDAANGYVFNLNYGHTTVFDTAIQMPGVKSEKDAQQFIKNVCVVLLTTDKFNTLVKTAKKRLRKSFEGVSETDVEQDN